MRLIFYISLVFLSSCFGGNNHGQWVENSGSENYVSNGERIYFTGQNQLGVSINSEGGSGGMHNQMHRGGGCASCHGADREGERLWPQFWISAPALTAEALFGDDSHDSDSDGHGDHADYDEESLRRAISLGVEPSGERLDSAMPRWTMSEIDMADLINFLQQSHDHD